MTIIWFYQVVASGQSMDFMHPLLPVADELGKSTTVLPK